MPMPTLYIPTDPFSNTSFQFGSSPTVPPFLPFTSPASLHSLFFASTNSPSPKYHLVPGHPLSPQAVASYNPFAFRHWRLAPYPLMIQSPVYASCDVSTVSSAWQRRI